LSQSCCGEISTFYPQPAGALLIALCAVDPGSFHSRCGEFSTINPQAFPVITHRLCTLSAAGPPLQVEGKSRDLVKIPFREIRTGGATPVPALRLVRFIYPNSAR
jgi:hypothetical protein